MECIEEVYDVAEEVGDVAKSLTVNNWSELKCISFVLSN